LLGTPTRRHVFPHLGGTHPAAGSVPAARCSEEQEQWSPHSVVGEPKGGIVPCAICATKISCFGLWISPMFARPVLMCA
jgi:hypothetical protein